MLTHRAASDRAPRRRRADDHGLPACGRAPEGGRPRVSVIIIVYNGEDFLADAVASVSAQSFPEWELIIVDDGSTDATPDLARRLARAEGRRIRVICHPDGMNRGMSASRNLGLAHARGEYVAFLDADDVWLPIKLQEQVDILDAHPVARLVYGRTLIWHSWAGGPGRDYFYELGLEAGRVHAPPRPFRLLLENRCQSPTTCNALIRASLVEEVGGFDDDFKGMFEDQVFFAKALLRAPVYVSDQTWAKYRQHELSCSARSAAAGLDAAAHLRFLARVAVHASTAKGASLETRVLAWRYLAQGGRRALRGGLWRVIGGLAR